MVANIKYSDSGLNFGFRYVICKIAKEEISASNLLEN